MIIQEHYLACLSHASYLIAAAEVGARGPVIKTHLHADFLSGHLKIAAASGFRSSIAASIPSRAGFADVPDLLSGYVAWAAGTSAAASDGARRTS